MTDTFLTRCPQCLTSFSVSESQLLAAQGTVRCGSCLKTFSAAEYRIPLENDTHIMADKSALRAGLSKLRNENTLEPFQADQLPTLSEPITFFKTGQAGPSHTLAWLSANIFLCLALAAQFVWFNLDALRERPMTAPASDFLCRYFPCTEDSGMDLSSLYIDDLLVQSHPHFAQALQVDFIIRNASPREQAFPLAELNFSDINQRLLANRQFTPEDYLPEELRHMTGIPPETSIQLRLEIVDPGLNAVNYALALRVPNQPGN